MTFSCGVVFGTTEQKMRKMNQKANHSAGRAATTKPPRTLRTKIIAVAVPIQIRTELRTGSGTRTLSVRSDTETRHVRFWPDGRRELMPRSYTSSRLFAARFVTIKPINNSRSIFARTESSYRRIEAQMTRSQRLAESEVRA